MDSFAWALVSQTAGLTGGNAMTDAARGVFLPSMLGFQLPPPAGLEHDNFPVDSGLVERAVRPSCFGAGNGTATSEGDHATGGGADEDDNAEPEVGGAHDDGPSAEAAAGDCSSGAPEPDSKKRKRSNEVCIHSAHRLYIRLRRLPSSAAQHCRRIAGRSWDGSIQGARRIRGFTKRERTQQRRQRQRERPGRDRQE
jgi:hypothetical protein